MTGLHYQITVTSKIIFQELSGTTLREHENTANVRGDVKSFLRRFIFIRIDRDLLSVAAE